MVVIQLGDRTASVQRHVVGANRREQGLAPIPRHNTVAMTAVVWDLLFPPENAIPKPALVSQSKTASNCIVTLVICIVFVLKCQRVDLYLQESV